MENVGENLSKYYESNQDKNQLSNFLTNSIKALNQIHELGVIHGDIKPENICVDETNTIKFIDFGLCQTQKTGFKIEMQGTQSYLSLLLYDILYDINNEDIIDKIIKIPKEQTIKEYLEIIDKWALGCSFYYLATKEHFIDKFYESTYQKENKAPTNPSGVSNNLSYKRYMKEHIIKHIKDENKDPYNILDNILNDIPNIPNKNDIIEEIKKLLLPTLEKIFKKK